VNIFAHLSLLTPPTRENGACLTLSGIGRLHYNEEKELAAVNYDTPWDAK
jgi:hypothetical protein